jgi:predicted transcriptional regulator of viral defense system
MKELSLYKVKDIALESGRILFSVQQLSNLIGKPRPIATVYSSRLVNMGIASRILKGRIAFEKDDFAIATQLIEPSYVSLDSALLFHGIINQITKNIECVTTRNSINYKDLGIRYHKIPKRLFFGYKRHSRGRSYVFVAEPEKALVDGLYLNIYSKREVMEYMDKLDSIRLETFIAQFKGRGSKKINRVIESSIKRNY